MKKIAFLVPELVSSGPINVVLSIIKNLDRAKFFPVIISVRHSGSLEYESNLSMCFNIELFFLSEYSSAEFGLKSIIKENGISCVHSHGYYPDKFLSKVGGVRKISTIHCMLYSDYIKEYGLLKGSVAAFSHFYNLKKGGFDYIVGCSSAVASYCKRFIHKNNIISINNGVDQVKYCFLSDREKDYLKYASGLEGKFLFIYSGRFIRRKKVPELIEFFLKNTPDSCYLYLLGDGPERLDCEARFSSNRIKFLGQIMNPEEYYKMADFIVSNSSAEGYPMSIIEAVSCGCYAFLSNIPPHDEFIINNPNSASYLSEISLKDFSEIKVSHFDVENLSARIMTNKYSYLYIE